MTFQSGYFWYTHTHMSEGVGNVEKGSCVRISVAQTDLSCRGSGSLS